MERHFKANHKYTGARFFIKYLVEELSQSGLFRTVFQRNLKTDSALQEIWQIRYKLKPFTFKSWLIADVEINSHANRNYIDLGIIISSVELSEKIEKSARKILKERPLTFDAGFVLNGISGRMEEQIYGRESVYLATRCFPEDWSKAADISEYEGV